MGKQSCFGVSGNEGLIFMLVPGPFEVSLPNTPLGPYIFNSPHSGSLYPKRFLSASRLDSHTLRASEDAFVDQLFCSASEKGLPLMRAIYPRAYLDLNREPYELDPRMFSAPLPPYANTRSVRVAGGLGTIARIVADSREIYADKLPVEEALLRVEQIYKPYHSQLRRLLAQTHVSFGYAVLLDCHSMPSRSSGSAMDNRADFILGDRYGTACSEIIVNTVAEFLRDKGYAVDHNKPYAGGFITEHYGRPLKGLHAMQIEINRSLYMDENTLEKHQGFDQLQQDIGAMIDHLIPLSHETFLNHSLAAE